VYRNPKFSTDLKPYLEALDNIEPNIEAGKSSKISNISRLYNMENSPSRLKGIYEKIKENPAVKFFTDDWERKLLYTLPIAVAKAIYSAIPNLSYTTSEIIGQGYKAVNLKPFPYVLHHLVDGIWRELNHLGIVSGRPPLEVSPKTGDPLHLASTIGIALLLNFLFDETFAYTAASGIKSAFRRLRKK